MTRLSSNRSQAHSYDEALSCPDKHPSQQSKDLQAYARLISQMALTAEKNFEATCLLKQQGITMRRLYLGTSDCSPDNRIRMFLEEMKYARQQAKIARALREKYTKLSQQKDGL